jgi:hypothetical protein
MQRDKFLHIALGICGLIAAYCGAFVLTHFGYGWFFAFSTTALGIGYEINQYVRKEGKVEILDALATASVGWLALIFLELF